ncbi:MAG: hypothetical protein ACKV19_10520 [Verrucomicrobiales bacterium]
MLALSWLGGETSQALERRAASANRADVGAAFAQCNNGDTLIIPAGVVTWDTNLHINKNINIQGDGVGKTIIIDDIDKTLGSSGNSNWNESAFSFATPTSSLTRLSGIEFRSGSRQSSYSTGIIQTEASAQFVIEHCKFDKLNRRALYFWGGSIGVVSKCDFHLISGVQAIVFFQSNLNGGSYGDGSYVNSPDYGALGAVYVEDCTIHGHTDGGLNMTDGFSGAKFVIRFNTIKEIGVGVHGTESTNRHRGARALEVYHNNFIDESGRPDYALIELRSGCGKFFNNTATGQWSHDFVLTNYRNWAAFPPWGGADGTMLWDKNDTSDGAATPGGAGDGVFEKGVSTNQNGLGWAEARGITVSQTGSTLTASKPVFTAQHVGKSLSIAWYAGFATNRKIISVVDASTATVSPSGTVTTKPFIIGDQNSLQDSTKNWTPGQWIGFTQRDVSQEFVAGPSNTRRVTVTGANWSVNQWFYWTATRVTDGHKAVVSGNTADTLTFSPNGAAIVFSAGDKFYLSRASEIIDSTATTLVTSGQGVTMPDYTYARGVSYEIRKVDHALDQPGRGRTSALNPPGTINIQPQNLNQQLDPIYSWGNQKNGIPFGFNIAQRTIKENREFYRSKPDFDGTSGMGVGPIAARPRRCVPGVAYWATDEGEWNSKNGTTRDGRLYVATATDTWTLAYTPLPYPHPLLQSTPASEKKPGQVKNVQASSEVTQ